MGQYFICGCGKFYPGVVIDVTTLPSLSAGAQIFTGERFIVRGRGFNSWPSEIVASTSEDFALNSDYSAFVIEVVEKSDSELILEVVRDYTLQADRVWSFFATPFSTPRSILSYTASDSE